MKSAKSPIVRNRSRKQLERATRVIGAIFEPMEQRQLMSGTLTITPANGAGNITLDVANGGVVAIVNGVETDYAAGQWSQVWVNTGSNSQPVNVIGTVVPVVLNVGQGQITLHGSNGLQGIHGNVTIIPQLNWGLNVKIDDSGDLIARNATLDLVNSYESLTGMAPATINFDAAATGGIDLISGNGADTLNIKHTHMNNVLNLDSGGGIDTVILGAGAKGIFYEGAYGIQGPVNVHNTPSLTHLVLDDWAYGSENCSLDGDGVNDTIHGFTFATTTWKVADVADLTLKTGYNGSYVNIYRTDRPLFIQGNTTTGNHPLINIGNRELGWPNPENDMTHILAPITISDTSGFADIVLHDENDPSARLVQMNSQSLTGLSPGAISWNTLDTHEIDVDLPHVGGNGVVVRGTGVPTYISSNSAADDTVTVANNGSVQGIAGALTISNDVGHTNLTIDDSADATGRNVTFSVPPPADEWDDTPYGTITGLAPAPISFEAVAMNSPVVVNGGSGGNTFTVIDTPENSRALRGGGPTINLNTGTGADTVNVQGSGVGTTLNIQGQYGLDTVKVGNAGLAQSVLGTINVANTGAYTTLTVDDSADLSPRTITLDTLPPLDGTHPRGSIDGIVPGVVNYVANDMKDPITISAGSGGNTIVVNNTPTKQSGGLSGNTINLNTGSGTDHVTIKAIGAGTTLNVEGQNGTDPVTVGNGGSVQGILGTLTVRNTSGYDALTIDDSADAANRVVTFGVINGVGDGDPLATITGLAPGVINFEANDVQFPTINGGSGANVYTVVGTPTKLPNGFGGPTITLFAGAGADIINVQGMGIGTSLKVYGQGADDVMTVDYSGGGIASAHSIDFDGGTSGPLGDSLTIKGKASDVFTLTAGNINRGAAGHVGYANVNTLHANTGTFNATADLNLPALVAQSAATTLNFNASQTIGKLVIDGAHVAMAPGGALSLALTSLNIVNSGRLDLADNGLLLTYGNGPDPLATIRGYLLSGYDSSNWDGPGISSSVAQNNPAHNTALGYADSADGTGVNLTPNSIKITYALYGDASLDKTVDTLDFNSLAANFGGTGKGWTQGDFNYDGTVDTLDFNNLAASFGKSLPAAPPAQASMRTLVSASMFSSRPIVGDLVGGTVV